MPVYGEATNQEEGKAAMACGDILARGVFRKFVWRGTLASLVLVGLTGLAESATPKADPAKCWNTRPLGECVERHRQVVAKNARVGDHRFIYTTVLIEPSGKVRVSTKFSQGQRVFGTHMCANIELLDNNGNALSVIEQRVGINATGGSRANEKTLTRQFALPAKVVHAINNVEINQTLCPGPGGLNKLKETWKELVDFANEVKTDLNDIKNDGKGPKK